MYIALNATINITWEGKYKMPYSTEILHTTKLSAQRQADKANKAQTLYKARVVKVIRYKVVCDFKTVNHATD
jgi:hypothetical protein